MTIVDRMSVRAWQLILGVSLSVQGVVGAAQTPKTVIAPITRQLRGLSADEATSLLAKLADAQRRLRSGEFQAFELLAGSIASYDKTNVSARAAFLQVPFDQVWNVERVRSDNRLWQPYRLAYAPDGLGKRYWDIEVVLGVNGNIERVQMIYKPPAPF